MTSIVNLHHKSPKLVLEYDKNGALNPPDDPSYLTAANIITRSLL